MGCEACKVENPARYHKCLAKRKESFRKYVAPCGVYFNRGSNITAPKKKRKRRK